MYVPHETSINLEEFRLLGYDTGLHGVISQKLKLSLDTAVRTSDSASLNLYQTTRCNVHRREK
jgi:hypothetical protein